MGKDPIRSKSDISAIKRLLHDSPRDSLLFAAGINNGLRAGDLLALTWGQVRDARPGESIRIVEQKTGKANILVVNKAVGRELERYRTWMDDKQPADELPLFWVRWKGSRKAMSVAHLGRLVQRWCDAINLRGDFGSHTLRKTFGYQQRVNFGVGYELLAQRYNHSSPAVTMRYLGIEEQEVVDILMNEI